MPPTGARESDSNRDSAKVSDDERKKLLGSAHRVASQAYAPYSRFRVGAAVLTAKGNVFTGCNVENASYSLTMCAERSAIFSAVAHEGSKVRIRALAVVCERDGPCSPCGACRQVIHEFGPEAVILFKGKGGSEERSLAELLPQGFELP